MCCLPLDARRTSAKCWACSVGLDCSTHQGLQYFDIRVRAFREGLLRKYHLVDLAIFDWNTGDYITDLIWKLLDNLFLDWKTSMIGLSKDEDRTMVDRIRGLVTRLEQLLGNCFVRIWCGFHQLDLVIQYVFCWILLTLLPYPTGNVVRGGLLY